MFTFLIAVLPIFLIWTGKVTRIDGVILILAFFVYAWWLFSKDDRFKKIYRKVKKESELPSVKRWIFVKNFVKIILILVILLALLKE